MEDIQDTLCGKMFPEPFLQTKEKTSGQSSKKSVKSNLKTMLFLSLLQKNGAMQETSWQTISPLRGECSMPSIGEFHSGEDGSRLSPILQEGVPEKYYLSQRA